MSSGASRTVRAAAGAAVGASSVGRRPSTAAGAPAGGRLAASGRECAGGGAGSEAPRPAVAALGQLPGGRAEEARAGAGLAEPLHAGGHVLEAGVDVEHLLVDEVGLVALAAVLVVEAEVDVDVLHVLGQRAAC